MANKSSIPGRVRRRKDDLVALKANPFSTYQGPRLTDQPKSFCKICGENLQGMLVADHLKDKHPTIKIELYLQEYPEGMPLPEIIPSEPFDIEDQPRFSEPPNILPMVSDAEAAEHPGGREAAQIEKTIEEQERKAYREDVVALISNGYPPSFEVATTAYNMLQVRRVRSTIEAARTASGERYVDTDYLDLLAALENRVREGIKLLEKIRIETLKLSPEEDPSKIIATELAEAEKWIQRHIGEFTERCGKCGELITPPNLPHWAYEKIETTHGPAWPVWSRELWQLVRENVIEPWVMAYILRTSIEGLKQTCERRGDTWPSEIDVITQENLLGERLLQDNKKTLMGDITS